MCVVFFNDPATTEIYTLSLHDAFRSLCKVGSRWAAMPWSTVPALLAYRKRSEEHTSELQSQSNLVCRLLRGERRQNAQPTTSKARRSQRAPLRPLRAGA